MVNFIANCADEQSFPLLARVTLLAKDAIVAAPIVLELLSITAWVWEAVRMERLRAKVATQEVLLVAKGSTEIAHLFEDKRRFLKGNLDRIRVPTGVSFIVGCQIQHQFGPLLVSRQFTFLDDFPVQVVFGRGCKLTLIVHDSAITAHLARLPDHI